MAEWRSSKPVPTPQQPECVGIWGFLIGHKFQLGLHERSPYCLRCGLAAQVPDCCEEEEAPDAPD